MSNLLFTHKTLSSPLLFYYYSAQPCSGGAFFIFEKMFQITQRNMAILLDENIYIKI